MTAQNIDPAQSLGHIAISLPGATAIFRRLKLDYCCGGQISLQQAADKKGVDLDALIAELTALQRSEDAPQTSSPAELIDHILARYHEVHKEQMPELIAMARRVESVHQGHPDVPVGLADTLEQIQEELLAHMMKEERVLFPMLRSGGNPFVVNPIMVMRSEHVEHGASLERLAALTNNMTPPAGACNTWRALYTGLNQFVDDLINHIHLENNALFPIFEKMGKVESDPCNSASCSCA